MTKRFEQNSRRLKQSASQKQRLLLIMCTALVTCYHYVITLSCRLSTFKSSSVKQPVCIGFEFESRINGLHRSKYTVGKFSLDQHIIVKIRVGLLGDLLKALSPVVILERWSISRWSSSNLSVCLLVIGGLST